MIHHGQEVVIVGGVHLLHRHVNLAIAVSKAMHGNSLQKTKNDGRFHVHTKTYLDGAMLKEGSFDSWEMEISTDVLAAGFLDVSDPGIFSKYFLRQVRHLWKQNELAQFVDPRLQSYDEEEVSRAIKVAILCTSHVAANRPPMSSVVSMLEGRIPVEVEKRSQMAVLGDDEEHASALLRAFAEIDVEFDSHETESQEITDIQETQHILRGKGKGKLSCYGFDIEAESSRAGEERE